MARAPVYFQCHFGILRGSHAVLSPGALKFTFILFLLYWGQFSFGQCTFYRPNDAPFSYPANQVVNGFTTAPDGTVTPFSVTKTVTYSIVSPYSFAYVLDANRNKAFTVCSTVPYGSYSGSGTLSPSQNIGYATTITVMAANEVMTIQNSGSSTQPPSDGNTYTAYSTRFSQTLVYSVKTGAFTLTEQDTTSSSYCCDAYGDSVSLTENGSANVSGTWPLTATTTTYSIVVPGAPFSAVPSVEACGSLPDSSSPISIQAMFVDSTTNSQGAGGTLTFTLAEVPYSGGHPHLGRPLGTLSTTSGASPLTATYTPDESSGTVNLTVSGTAPDGSTPAPLTVAINIGWLGSPFTQLSGIAFSIASHPQGTYGTTPMQAAVADFAEDYSILTGAVGDKSPTPLRSEAASLPLGGIFDIDLDWTEPHCGHRNGLNVDLSLSNTTGLERAAMQVAAIDAGLAFYYVPESPSNPNTNHWHASLAQ